MSRSSLLGLLLLLGVGAGLAMLLVRNERRASVGAQDSSATEEPERSSEGKLLAPAKVPSEGRNTLDDGAPPDEAENFIRGTVLVPGGIPAGEEVRLLAALYLGSENRSVVRKLAQPVASDGSFTLAVPRGTRYALLDLESRFLYLSEPVRAASGETGVVLAPEVSAILVGRVLPPLGVTIPNPKVSWKDVEVSYSVADEPHPRAGGFALDLQGQSPSVWSLSGGNGGAPSADGAFEFDHVPVCVALELEAQSPFGPPIEQRVDPFGPGEKRSVTIALECGSTLAGLVLDENGLPVEGVSISTAIPGTPEPELPFGSSTSDDHGPKTDAGGRFELLVAHRSWTVRARKDDLARGTEALVDASAGDVRDLVLSVVRGGCIDGTVRWPDGRLAESFQASAAGPGGFGFIFEGRAGHFRLCALGDGLYQVDATANGAGVVGKAHAVGVRCGETQLDLVLEETASYSVRGTVVDANGSPIRGLSVSAQSEDGFHGASSEMDGNFRIRGLPAGEATIHVLAPGYLPAEQKVDIGPNPPGPLRFVLMQGGHIRGQVLDSRGQPVAGAAVVRGESFGRYEDSDKSGADGSFTVAASARSTTLVAKKKGYAPSDPVTVEIGEGATVEGIVMRLREACRLSGTVLDAAGRPAPGVTVILYVPESWPRTETDAAGAFVLDGLAPGVFDIQANPQDDSGAHADSTVELDPSRPCSIVLRFEKSDPVRVRGTITKGGKPLACQLGFTTKGFSRMSSTGADGRFELTLQQSGECRGVIWVGSSVPDFEKDDVRRFALSIPKGEYSFDLEFNTLTKLLSSDDLWR